MATREENLKKINDELEKLSDDELDNVAGGTCLQNIQDSQVLHKLGFMDFEFRSFGIFDSVDPLIEGWKKAGVQVITDYGVDNVYKINENWVSRNDAIAYAEKKAAEMNAGN
ncbi:MAG: hypothetical protein IJ685_06310 [Selenomonadaceae bacterium]|nr:hypothetical protein [Selenomonadaceae bacterium]